MFKQISLSLLFGLLSVSAFATHLISGTLSYKYVSSTANDVTYKISLELYRDCVGWISATVQFDPEINIGVYINNTAKTKYKTGSIKLITKRIVPMSNCYMNSNPNYCVEAGLYESNITLEKNTVGYYLAQEVCCRIGLDNVQNSGSTPDNGITFLNFIPPTSISNIAPLYNYEPTLVNGINKLIEDDWSATDSEGDSLVYSIVAPYKGGDISISKWLPPSNLATPTSVNYVSGYSFTNPFGNAGTISIDQTTGKLTFSNSSTGVYAFCVEINEFRNKVLIGKYRRDNPLTFINTPPETGFKILLLKPVVVDDKSISLSWRTCPNSYTTYTIERKTRFGLFNKIGATARRDTVNTIPQSTWYFYRVKAMINSVEVISNVDSVYIHPASIKSNTSNPVSVYPNPVKDYLYIDYPSVTSCSIYEVTGKLLSEQKEMGNTPIAKLDTRALLPGLYFIMVKTDQGIFSQRFVKE